MSAQASGPDDVPAAEASERLGLAVGGGGVDLAASRQDKIDVLAKWDGVLIVKVPGLLLLNTRDPLEVYTLLNGQCVVAGQVVASARVTGRHVSGEVLRQGIRIAREQGPIVEVRPYQRLQVPAIVCEAADEGVRRRFEASARHKLAALGSELGEIIDAAGATPGQSCDRALEAIHRVAEARVVLVAGMPASDVSAPFAVALTQAGGTFVRRGLPAEPGSEVWLARREQAHFLGLPNCRMFSLATAADLVLPSLLTGEQLDSAAVAALAHGGVLSADMRFRMPAYARELESPGS